MLWRGSWFAPHDRSPWQNGDVGAVIGAPCPINSPEDDIDGVRLMEHTGSCHKDMNLWET